MSYKRTKKYMRRRSISPPVPLHHKLRQKQTVSIPTWLSARYLLRSLDDNTIKTCYNQIIDLFNNERDIIYMLIKAGTSDQIENMIEILKTSQTECIENDNNNSYFHYLPTESVWNIAEFLNKNDMISFKLVSVSMALIAFDIMKCYMVGVFNMNEIIEKHEYKYQQYLNIPNKVKINRVKPFIKYKSLINIYCKRYNISFENMLILRSNAFIDISGNMNLYKRRDERDDTNSFCKGTILKSSNDLNAKIQQSKALLILDKTKVLSLNGNLKPTIISKLEENEYDNNYYHIILLQYFDRDQQRIQNIQYLLLNPTTTTLQIKQYIQNDLYSIITNIYKNISPLLWSHKLLHKLSKMKEFGTHRMNELINIYTTTKCPKRGVIFNSFKAETIINDLNIKTTTKASVDEYFSYKHDCIVYDEGFDGVYNAMLNYGDDQFFKLQVLKRNESGQYYTFFRWGPVGTVGKTQDIEGNAIQCINAFKTKFFEKTGNDWDDRHHFDLKKGMYSYLRMNYQCNAVRTDFKVITFELNTNHPFFKQPDNENEYELYDEIKAIQPFYENVRDFSVDQESKYLIWINNIDPDFEYKAKYFDINEIEKGIELNLKVTPLTKYGMIQNKLSQKLNNKIASNNIEIYEMTKAFETGTEKQILSIQDVIGPRRKREELYWSIVPYDTLSKTDGNMHKIMIYEPKNNDNDNTLQIGWSWNEERKENKNERKDIIVNVDEVYQRRVIKIYQKINEMEKLEKILNKMDNHQGDNEWLHTLYIRICNKYNIKPEPKVNPSQSPSYWFMDNDNNDNNNNNNNNDDLFGAFPENATFEVYLRYKEEVKQQEIIESTKQSQSKPDVEEKQNEDISSWNNNNSGNAESSNWTFNTSNNDTSSNWTFGTENKSNNDSSSNWRFETINQSNNDSDFGWNWNIASNIDSTQKEQELGSKGWRFRPFVENDNRNKSNYYQHISIGNKTFLNKSSDELRFEDEYGKIAINNNNNNNDTVWSFGTTQNNSNNSWSFNSDSLTNNGVTITVDKYIKNMMDMISHPMYGDKYKSIIDKYNDKDKYSLIIMDDNDIYNQQFKCYDNNEKYLCRYKSKSKLSHSNVVIIENIKDLVNDDDDDDNKSDKKECFPIIVRLCKKPQFFFGFGSNTGSNTDKLNIGYPQKLWITKQTKVKDVVNRYLNINNTNKLIFDSCLTSYGYLDINDNIFDKTQSNDENTQNTQNTVGLLIQLHHSLFYN